MKLHKFINMNKLIVGSFLAIGLLLGCKKKEKEPLEYFSFTANGVDYYYPQEERTGFLGVNQALWAGPSSGNLGYFLGASNFEDPVAPGTFRFTFFPTDQIPQEDTIILTERTEKKLSGTFAVEATRTTTPVAGSTDSILHVTNGKFSIIPTIQNE